MAVETPPLRSLVYRWRRWLVLLAVLLVLRAALPEILRRVIVSQASQRLQTRVDVGDVDLALYRGGVALEDVALFSPTPLAPDEPPLVAWKRLAVEVRYLPLLWKTVQLRQIVLDGPRVALDRLSNGELNLRRLVPASEPAAEEPSPQQASESGWKTGIDRFVLRAGGVRFRDLMLPEGEPLEIAIPDVTVGDIALQPGLYGEPGRVRLFVKTEGGSVHVESQMWALAHGFALGTRVKAFRLPLRRARLYVPGVGWSELGGQVDAVVDHGLAPGGKNELYAFVRLRNVDIQVPEVPQAAFAVRRLAVRIAPLDLTAHRAHVRMVDIAGASVLVDLQGGQVLPLLRRGATSEPATPPEPPPPQPPSGEAPAWRWTLDRLQFAESKVSLVQEGGPLDIGVTAALHDVADEGKPGHLELTLTVPPGSLAVTGAVQPTPPGFGGNVKIGQLPVHDLVRAARAAANLPPGFLKAAVLDADLAIEAGLGADGSPAASPSAVLVKGTLGLDGVQLQGPDPALFAVGWKRLAVPIDTLVLPGLLPGPPTPPAPLRVALGAVRLDEPTVQMARTADGFVLPPLLQPKPSGETPAAATPAAASPASPPPPAPEVTIGSFVLSRGRVGFVDQTVKPFFAGEIKPLDIDARGIRAAGPVVERFKITATTPQKGKLDVSGSVRPEGGTIKVNGESVLLTPYNAYVTAFSPYSLGKGSSISVRTDVAFGKEKYDAKTALTLQRLSVKGAGGDTVFKQQFGIPLSMALALLRDPSGNIKLDIPVVVDQSGTKVALGTVLGSALRGAILGAVTSPLKAVGVVFGSGDKEVSLEPPPIAMEVGQAVLTAEGDKQLAQLAQFLAGRPGLGVELDGVVTAADQRWLREQDLRTELEARTGMVNALRGLRQRGVRQRILAALAERATGKPGKLDDDDEKELDAWLAERPALPAERLRELARARTSAVATALREQHGIPAERVTVGEPAGEPREGTPSVSIAFGAPEE